MSKPTPKVDAFASGTHVPADHQIGLVIEPHFTKGTGHHPFTQIEWEKRTVAIRDESGKVVFEQENVEVPKSWSALAGQVVASKYFRGTPGTPEREQSVRRVIGRVVDTITEWGRKGRYFVSEGDATAFEYELSYLLVNQYAAFNSPVWFNVGAEAHPQCSACFINSVDDDMGSILDLAKTEGMLFKYGSGTGSNLSAIRSSKENLNGGGSASGPVSFMRGFDAFAGAIKSGGKTRRAAKMVILDADHPDILEFIRAKATAERAAHALIEGGFDGSFNVQGGAYDLVPFQNANHSVRATDDFMEAHGYGYDDTLPRMWPLKARTTGKIVEQCSARELFEEIAKAAHFCGDPGMQFHDTINKWHTCKESGPINSSNPCSEYMFLDDTACNLASLNLMKFRNADGTLNVADFRAAVDIVFLAMEIIVGNSSYPTERIRDNSFAYRPLGLGYANLGAFLMSAGYAYDSDEGRDIAASITALMHGYANRRSAEIASQHGGPFAMFEQNRESMLDVMLNHYNAAMKLTFSGYSRAIREVWEDVMRRGQLAGFRNAQATVLAPTGTIGFMMDCDTTGIEPDIALIKYKKLVGEGFLKIVNQTVPAALKKLGYSAEQTSEIL
ncbi:MAG TPA: vitamin B12-dependent ribonucleotide reductase, partial [Archangium sp.]